MPKIFVVKHHGEWTIKDGLSLSEPFATQRSAVRAAIDRAKGAGTETGNAQVVIQGEDSLFRTKWTYGHDPYPPRG